VDLITIIDEGDFIFYSFKAILCGKTRSMRDLDSGGFNVNLNDCVSVFDLEPRLQGSSSKNFRALIVLSSSTTDTRITAGHIVSTEGRLPL